MRAVIGGKNTDFPGGVYSEADSFSGEVEVSGTIDTNPTTSLTATVQLTRVDAIPRGVPLVIHGDVLFAETDDTIHPYDHATFVPAADHAPAIRLARITRQCKCDPPAGKQAIRGTITLSSPVGKPLVGSMHLEVDTWKPPQLEPAVIDATFTEKLDD
jgi:hypothetical protein